MKNLSHDTFFNGQISLKQPLNGYRFSIDAVILGNLADVKPGGKILDLGTGCGVIPLIICFRHPDTDMVFGAEIQEELAQIAKQNAADNNLQDKITILHTDIKKITPADTGGKVESVLCNPPHFTEKSGRINPDSQRAVARHEIAMTLSDLASAASRMLVPGGGLTVIYPCERLADLLETMRRNQIEPKKIRMIHPAPETPARKVLACGIKGKNPGLSIAPPLYIRTDPDHYSQEVDAMFRP
ncbi:MAG: tRNA1(Val) (adenine(37)-N6)-methyltransferase [Desulfobacteraceae bacterium]|nr:tRNA1(Val) (adenine(37)-N6)-methyltransferase [Desulfobacteraceae bacterium]